MTGLVWSGREHWATNAAPCRHCGKPTNLRDDQRKPSHKTCAENAPDTTTSHNRRR